MLRANHKTPLPPPTSQPRLAYVAVQEHVLPPKEDFWKEFIQKRPEMSTARARAFFFGSKVFTMMQVVPAPEFKNSGKGKCCVCSCSWDGYPVASHSALLCPVPKEYQRKFIATNTAAVCLKCTSRQNFHLECSRYRDYCHDCDNNGKGKRDHIPLMKFCDVENDMELAYCTSVRREHFKLVADLSHILPWKIAMPNDKPIRYHPDPRMMSMYPYNEVPGEFRNVKYQGNPNYPGIRPVFETPDHERIHTFLERKQLEYERAYARQEELKAESEHRMEFQELERNRDLEGKEDGHKRESEDEKSWDHEMEQQRKKQQELEKAQDLADQMEVHKRRLQIAREAEERKLQCHLLSQPRTEAADRLSQMRQQVELYKHILPNGAIWSTAVRRAILHCDRSQGKSTTSETISLNRENGTIDKVGGGTEHRNRKLLHDQVKAAIWTGISDGKTLQAIQMWQIMLSGCCERAEDLQQAFDKGNGVVETCYELFLQVIAIILSFSKRPPKVILGKEQKIFNLGINANPESVMIPTSFMYTSATLQQAMTVWNCYVAELANAVEMSTSDADPKDCKDQGEKEEEGK